VLAHVSEVALDGLAGGIHSLRGTNMNRRHTTAYPDRASSGWWPTPVALFTECQPTTPDPSSLRKSAPNWDNSGAVLPPPGDVIHSGSEWSALLRFVTQVLSAWGAVVSRSSATLGLLQTH